MQERGLTLNGLVKGLRPYTGMPVNSEELVECFNLIPKPEGLVPPLDIQKIPGIVVDWPFPQIFFGCEHWLLCTRTQVFKINGDLSLTLEATVIAGDIWQFADFFTYGVLTNGVSTLEYDTISGIWTTPDVNKIPILSAVCNFNGQILGAVDNTFMWGGIGSADFTIDKSNTRGRRPMPWFGEIYRILKLGTGLVIYGSNGISIVRFKDETPGILKVLGYGLRSAGAVAGDDEHHVFVDSMGNLRTLTGDGKVSGPMYLEFFSGMSEIVINYTALDDAFFISDGNKCFVKTPEGLGETFQCVSGFGEIGGRLIGVYKEPAWSGISSIVTDIMDFGVRSHKTIEGVEVGASGSGEIRSIVYWRNSPKDSFQHTGWVTNNQEGYATFPIGGTEFKIGIECDNYADFKISYIGVRVKFDDKRTIRGISNASKAAAGTGQ